MYGWNDPTGDGSWGWSLSIIVKAVWWVHGQFYTVLSTIAYVWKFHNKLFLTRTTGCHPERWAPALPGPPLTLTGVSAAHTRLPGTPHCQPRIGEGGGAHQEVFLKEVMSNLKSKMSVPHWEEMGGAGLQEGGPRGDIGRGTHKRCAERWGHTAHALGRWDRSSLGKDQMWLWRAGGVGKAPRCWGGRWVLEVLIAAMGTRRGARLGSKQVSRKLAQRGRTPTTSGLFPPPRSTSPCYKEHPVYIHGRFFFHS